jgi:hypothetical protein
MIEVSQEEPEEPQELEPELEDGLKAELNFKEG